MDKRFVAMMLLLIAPIVFAEVPITNEPASRVNTVCSSKWESWDCFWSMPFTLFEVTSVQTYGGVSYNCIMKSTGCTSTAQLFSSLTLSDMCGSGYSTMFSSDEGYSASLSCYYARVWCCNAATQTTCTPSCTSWTTCYDSKQSRACISSSCVSTTESQSCTEQNQVVIQPFVGAPAPAPVTGAFITASVSPTSFSTPTDVVVTMSATKPTNALYTGNYHFDVRLINPKGYQILDSGNLGSNVLSTKYTITKGQFPLGVGGKYVVKVELREDVPWYTTSTCGLGCDVTREVKLFDVNYLVCGFSKPTIDYKWDGSDVYINMVNPDSVACKFTGKLKYEIRLNVGSWFDEHCTLSGTCSGSNAFNYADVNLGASFTESKIFTPTKSGNYHFDVWYPDGTYIGKTADKAFTVAIPTGAVPTVLKKGGESCTADSQCESNECCDDDWKCRGLLPCFDWFGDINNEAPPKEAMTQINAETPIEEGYKLPDGTIVRCCEQNGESCDFVSGYKVLGIAEGSQKGLDCTWDCVSWKCSVGGIPPAEEAAMKKGIEQIMRYLPLIIAPLLAGIVAYKKTDDKLWAIVGAIIGLVIGFISYWYLSLAWWQALLLNAGMLAFVIVIIAIVAFIVIKL